MSLLFEHGQEGFVLIPSGLVNEMDAITDTLYLGDVDAATNLKELDAKEIKTVITVRDDPISMSKRLARIEYKHLCCQDEPNFRLDYYFHQVAQWIEDARKPVLVHCQAGRSRSASSVVAYLMLNKNDSFANALAHVQKCRPVVDLNPGFYKQLQLLDALLPLLARVRKIYFLILGFAGLP